MSALRWRSHGLLTAWTLLACTPREDPPREQLPPAAVHLPDVVEPANVSSAVEREPADARVEAPPIEPIEPVEPIEPGAKPSWTQLAQVIEDQGHEHCVPAPEPGEVEEHRLDGDLFVFIAPDVCQSHEGLLSVLRIVLPNTDQPLDLVRRGSHDSSFDFTVDPTGPYFVYAEQGPYWSGSGNPRSDFIEIVGLGTARGRSFRVPLNLSIPWEPFTIYRSKASVGGGELKLRVERLQGEQRARASFRFALDRGCLLAESGRFRADDFFAFAYEEIGVDARPPACSTQDRSSGRRSP